MNFCPVWKVLASNTGKNFMFTRAKRNHKMRKRKRGINSKTKTLSFWQVSALARMCKNMLYISLSHAWTYMTLLSLLACTKPCFHMWTLAHVPVHKQNLALFLTHTNFALSHAYIPKILFSLSHTYTQNLTLSQAYKHTYTKPS